jgi:NAD(P)-dependent dehydrogenase (short-subunit alcohol dehydrogenase family)
MKRLKGKRAAITGAGSGLGRALSLELAKQGWRILVTDIQEKRAQETLHLVTQAGGTGDALYCDVTAKNQVAAMADKMFCEWGGVDLLINNAGVSMAGFVGKSPLENWQWIVDIDLLGVIYGCHFFIPHMKKMGAGHIVNIASNAGIASLPEMAAYNVTKAGVISLSETLRSELAPYNIGVTAVCPSFFTSNLLENFRYDTEEQYRIAEKLFNWWFSMDSHVVARRVLRAVQKNKLYVLPQIDAKFVWYAKRFFPSAYFAVISFCYRRGIHKWLLKIP